MSSVAFPEAMRREQVLSPVEIAGSGHGFLGSDNGAETNTVSVLTGDEAYRYYGVEVPFGTLLAHWRSVSSCVGGNPPDEISVLEKKNVLTHKTFPDGKVLGYSRYVGKTGQGRKYVALLDSEKQPIASVSMVTAETPDTSPLLECLQNLKSLDLFKTYVVPPWHRACFEVNGSGPRAIGQNVAGRYFRAKAPRLIIT